MSNSLNNFYLKSVLQMSQEQQHGPLPNSPKEAEPGSSSKESAGDQPHPRGTHAASYSSPPRSQNLKPSSKPGKKERTTWTGTEERTQSSKRQPIRVPGRRDQERQLEQSRSPHHYQEYVPSGGMYVVYEDQEINRTRDRTVSFENSVPLVSPCDGGSIQVTGEHSGRSRDTNNTFIGEIDGRYSFSEGSPDPDEFVRVEINTDTTSTSHELMECKRTVLKPYLIFLKVIGWRRFQEKSVDLNEDKFRLIVNTVYPAVIFLLLAATIIIQDLTCYFRTQPANYKTGPDRTLNLPIVCTEHIVTTDVIPNILILTAYLYGIYIFRYGEPEHLASLIETVFLSIGRQMTVSKKRIVRVLRSYLVLGSLWILLDFTLNGVRMYSLQLLEQDSFSPALRIPPDRQYNRTTIHTTQENVLRYIFVLISPFGFVLYDMLYFAVVVAYVSQSQLIQYYITSIIEKVRTKAYSLEDAIKDIRQTYTYLQVLNSKLSTLTTLMLFLFLSLVLSSIYNLAQFPERDTLQNTPIFYVGVFVGIGDIIQWSLLAAAPLVQASRLTSQCRQLRRLGLEIGSRPFVYAGTPQLDLDYFVQYTNTTRYTAKLASVPVYPWLVVGSIFLGGIIGCFVISINNHFVFASWF